MNTSRLPALMAVVLLFGACTLAPRDDAGSRVSRHVSGSRTVLEDAAAAARAYGQAHLGHFIDLDVEALEREGLELRDPIKLAVHTTHTSYCVVAVNEALPSIHPWARASVSSRQSKPSHTDRCEAGRQSGG